jgi:FAD/FMN-containing dehydrogenase
MAWAPAVVFSFVLYHRQSTSAAARDAVGTWTRALIDAVLAHQGRYYLPYQLHATQAQFDAAYPQARALAALKRRVDPRGRLSNALWTKYL